MRLHRFYVEQPLGEEVVIDDVSLIKQWSKVFRYTETDFVTLFNGDGNDITYSIQKINSKEATLLRTKLIPSYITKKNITLYLSLIKKDNFELVAQKATELGVTKIVPIISERSEKKNLNEDRLRKITIEASEQCGRGDIPFVEATVNLQDVIQSLSTTETSLLMQMGGMSLLDKKIQEKCNNTTISVFIGPEGGWTTREEELFKEKGALAVSLGETVLRAETAAIAAISILQLA